MNFIPSTACKSCLPLPQTPARHNDLSARLKGCGLQTTLGNQCAETLQRNTTFEITSFTANQLRIRISHRIPISMQHIYLQTRCMECPLSKETAPPENRDRVGPNSFCNIELLFNSVLQNTLAYYINTRQVEQYLSDQAPKEA